MGKSPLDQADEDARELKTGCLKVHQTATREAAGPVRSDSDLGANVLGAKQVLESSQKVSLPGSFGW